MSRKCQSKKTILYEAHFTPEQEAYAELCAKARMIAWNYVLKELDQHYFLVDKGIVDPYKDIYDFNALSRRMTVWRKTEPTVSQVPRFVMGAALIDVKKTYLNNLRNICGRPQFKNWNDPETKRTFQLYKNLSGEPLIRKLNGNYGKFRISNKFKWVKIRLENEWQNPNLCSLVIRKYEDGKWRIILVWDTEDSRQYKGDGSSIGIDVGSDHALSLSNGQFYDVPNDIEDLARKIRDFDAMLDRKQKGSGRWHKLNRRKKQLNIRKTRKSKGWIDRIVHDISSRYDTVFVEDIDLTELAEGDWNNKKAKGKRKSKSKRTVNRKMKQANLGLFRRKLNEKTNVVSVPAPYTSQDCPNCGHREAENRNRKHFNCKACGRRQHADTNAAKNILKRGLIQAGLPGHMPASVKERIHPSSNGLALEQRLAEALASGKLSLSSSFDERQGKSAGCPTVPRQNE